MNKFIILLFLFPVLALSNTWPQISQDELKFRLSELNHTPWDRYSLETKTKVSRGCVFSNVSLRIRSENGQSWNFIFSLARPEKTQKTSLMLLLPTIERKTPLESTLVYQFCKAHYSVALIDASDKSQPDQLPAWGHEDQVLRKTILTLRTVLDWAYADQRFHKSKIGLYGHSLGGITAALLAGLEPDRLNAVIVAVGAGNMPGILTHSLYPRISTLRWRRYKALRNKSPENYEQLLRQHLRYDPLTFAAFVKTEKLYFAMAKSDISVPYRYQLQTHRAFGAPQFHLFSPGSHFDGMLRLATIDFDKVLSFLRSRQM